MGCLPRLFQTGSWVLSLKKTIAADIIVFGIILGDFHFHIDNGMLCVLIKIASMRSFKWEHTTFLHVKENWKDIPIMPPDLVLLLTLISLTSPCLKHIFMLLKKFEPLKFYCNWNTVEKDIKLDVILFSILRGISKYMFRRAGQKILTYVCKYYDLCSMTFHYTFAQFITKRGKCALWCVLLYHNTVFLRLKDGVFPWIKWLQTTKSVL